MKKYWLHNSLFDTIFLLSPPFVVLLALFAFQSKISYLETHYSFWTWLFFIVCIDVAHVYATLFKTYFNPNERNRLKKELTYIPLLCFCISFFLYSLGYQLFWSVLAYIAVFHFIRQQYGFLRLYLRKETNNIPFIEHLTIYNATIFPMCYWFFGPKRHFDWFVENEFIQIESPKWLAVLTILYWGILISYLFYIFYSSIKFKTINVPKLILVLGTYSSWYMGIVYFNNDFAFTALNVVSHGIPYIGLIFINQRKEEHLKWIPKINHWKGIAFYLGLLLILAFAEELIWELSVWQEHFNWDFLDIPSKWQFFLVPLLMVPQFTHYVLDGIIWKKT